MKTLLKTISIFVIFFTLVAIKGCYIPISGTLYDECDITDFDIYIPCNENDTIAYKNFYIYLDAQPYWECHEVDTVCQINLNLTNSLYAVNREVCTEGKIKSIDIYSNADYDSLHPAGTPLNDIFSFFADDYINGKIDELISNIQFPIKTYPDFSLSISKNYPPDSLRLHQFTVIYKEVDSTIITKTLPPVYISPY